MLKLNPNVSKWKSSKSKATKWQAQATIKLPEGSKRVTAYGPTRDAAKEKLYSKAEAALAKAKAEHSRDTGSTTFHQLMVDLMEYKYTILQRKRRTIEDYMDNYKLHIKPYIGAKQLQDITYAELEDIQKRLLSQGKYRTADLSTILLKDAFKYASKRYRQQIRQGIIPPLDFAEDLEKVKIPKTKTTKEKLEQAWTREQVSAFLKHSKHNYETTRSLYYPAFYTLFATGLRYGEMIGMKREAITHKNGKYYLHVKEQLVANKGKLRSDTPKTKSGDRMLAISQQHLHLLEAHIAKCDRIAKRQGWKSRELLFPNFKGNPIGHSNFTRTKDVIIEELGLPRITLHHVRKLSATFVAIELLAAGQNPIKGVQHFLGHSSPQVGQDIYNQVTQDDVDEAIFLPVDDD